VVGGGGMGPNILSMARPSDSMRPSWPGGAEICMPAGVPVLSIPIGKASAAGQSDSQLIGQSASQQVSQSASQPVSQSDSQPIRQSQALGTGQAS